MAKKVLLPFAAFLALVIVTLYHSSSSTISPSDLIGMKEAHGVAVQGKVEETFSENGQTYFYISDGRSKIRAVYAGQVNYGDIIALGDWKEGIFYVKEVLKKCHTEYGG